MPTYTYALTGGTDAVAGYGDQWKVGFIGTWNALDSWTLAITGGEGNLTIGLGVFANLSPSVCFTYKKRVYIGAGSRYLYSENGDPTAWEEQDAGAGFQPYLSEFGYQDGITAISQIQGRLAIFAGRSIQIWTPDADPNNFAIVQTLDNIGTNAPLSVQNLGDYDVLFLDSTGIRSLRSREVTLNAYVDDVGSPIDSFIQDALLTYNASTAVGIVEPTDKDYWIYLGGNIYVFSRHPSSKIAAWSTYVPSDNYGVTFLPRKMVVLNGRTYIRAQPGVGGVDYLYLYGGASNNSYDANTIVSIQTPWLFDKTPDTLKQFVSMNTVIQGRWTITISADPQSNTFKTVIPARGIAATPSSLADSTYDLMTYPVPGLKGTHFSVKAVSTPAAATLPALLSELTVHYNKAGDKTT
jgi:hypothetical protein